MKKAVCVLLAAALIFALAACGSSPKEAEVDLGAAITEELESAEMPSASAEEATPAAEEATPAEEEAAPAEEEATPAEEEAAPAEEEATPAEEEATPAEEEATPAEEELDAKEVLGEKNGNSYANKALGIRATLPESWMVLSEEQTAQLMGYVANGFSDEAMAELLRKSGQLCDLYAMSSTGTDSVNIQIQDLGALYGSFLSEELYLNVSVQQLPSSLEQLGMKEITTKTERFLFAGEEHSSVMLTGKINGILLYERLVLVKASNYMAVVTASSLDENMLDSIFACFEAYSA